MKVIVGLGNVGAEYETTRHNVGFMVVQQLGEQHRVRWTRHGVSLCGPWRAGSTTVKLMLPQTMMNGSGQALTHLADEPVAPHDMLIVLDDVNLPVGALRLRPAGGAGGHHGLESCLAQLGTETVPRLRVGVGVEPLPDDLTEFVLSPFRTEERVVMRQTLARAVEVCHVWAQDGLEVAMNQMSRYAP